jgi:tetratricopeptide (TPR) repeat protein
MNQKIFQMMTTTKKLLLLFGVGLMSLSAAKAQGYKVESVRMVLENPDPTAEKNLRKCMEDIEAAAQHPKTASDPKMYYYKALTYFNIYASDEELLKEVPNALDISTDNFFKSMEADAKNKYSDNSKFYLLNCAIGLYNQGINAYNNKDYKAAVAAYDMVLKILPYDEKDDLKRKNITQEAMYQYKYYAGMAAEDWDLAKANLQKLIDLNFMEPRIYADMARIYLTETDTAKALEYISQGKEMFENDKMLINMELDIYLKQGRSGELIQKLDNAIASDDQNPMYYFARAITYEGMKDKEKAEADYKKTIEIDPNFYDAYYNLGVLYINKSNALVEKLDQVYKQSEFDKIDGEITALYKEAIGYFESALENPEMGEVERKDLAGTMKRIYAKLKNESKVAEMKSIIDN